MQGKDPYASFNEDVAGLFVVDAGVLVEVVAVSAKDVVPVNFSIHFIGAEGVGVAERIGEHAVSHFAEAPHYHAEHGLQGSIRFDFIRGLTDVGSILVIVVVAHNIIHDFLREGLTCLRQICPERGLLLRRCAVSRRVAHRAVFRSGDAGCKDRVHNREGFRAGLEAIFAGTADLLLYSVEIPS